MSKRHTEYFTDNLKSWDAVAKMHAQGSGAEFYRITEFLQGECKLGPWELEEVGDVAGKSLLHLQCHIGTDTLSWSRYGVQVTGLDFSPAAIHEAERFARLLNIEEARFVVSAVSEAVNTLNGEQFDIVYTGRGAICWLPDLDEWAGVCAQLVLPTGILYMEETHPTLDLMEVIQIDGKQVIQPKYDPFDMDPVSEDYEGSYADPNAKTGRQTNHCWEHGFSEIINALVKHGFEIELLNERPWAFFVPWEDMFEPVIPNYWQLKDGFVSLPMSYSLRARKRC
ncbi:MAG: class I SAM-dependent methyltransferase [Planctomycetaceae bacterium]|nr:class I SAM-dependent methyltransferase [Planctomycetaceae bacterium]